jgi:hypothetical protein
MRGVELGPDAEVVLDRDDLAIFEIPDGKIIALMRIDENEDPVEGADPNDYGFLPTAVLRVDGTFGLLYAEVIPLSSIVSQISFLGED